MLSMTGQRTAVAERSDLRAMPVYLRACLLALVAAASALALAPRVSRAAERRPVLVLHSYHKGLRWTDSEDAGMSSVLAARPDLEVHTEYMDSKRVEGEAHESALLSYYQGKFRGVRFAAVLVSDDAAYNFALAHRAALFPDAPIVFCGVNYFTDPEDDRLRDVVTGVVEAFDAGATVRAAMRLQNDVRRVVVVNDRTVTGLANRRILRDVVREFEGRVAFEYLEDLDVSGVLARVRSLSRGDVVLLLTLNRDRSGRVIDYDEAVALVSGAASVPVYGVWDFYLGRGIVGGMLTSGFDQGRMAAEMAVSIVDGTPVRSLPVVRRSPNRYMFDARQLRRHGLARADLPASSIVVNEPASFYEVNKDLMRGTFAALGALTLIIALLLLNVRQRRREAAAQRFLADVSRELGASIDLEATGPVVAHMAVPRLASAALLHVEDGAGAPRAWIVGRERAHGRGRRAATLPVPAATVPAVRARPCVARAMVAGTPVVTRGRAAEDWPDGLVEPGRVSLETTFPLVAGGRTLGTLSLATRRRMTAHDLALATELAHRAATALLNASLFGRVENAVRARDEFLAIASHELKTPLTPLRMRIQMLQRCFARGEGSRMRQERIENALSAADEEIERLVVLIDDLLDMSDVTTREVDIDPAPSDLGGVVEDVVARHRHELARAGCSLSTRIARGVVGSWDRRRIEQVCTALLANAIKYAPGPIDVEVEADALVARVSVRDRGAGISPADRERVFLPFERAISYTKASGFGLGLYRARQIATAHGGTLRLESPAEGGSAFVLELPRVAQAGLAPSPPLSA
jgi:signal transduction histidine kinase